MADTSRKLVDKRSSERFVHSRSAGTMASKFSERMPVRDRFRCVKHVWVRMPNPSVKNPSRPTSMPLRSSLARQHASIMKLPSNTISAGPYAAVVFLFGLKTIPPILLL